MVINIAHAQIKVYNVFIKLLCERRLGYLTQLLFDSVWTILSITIFSSLFIGLCIALILFFIKHKK